MNIDWPRLILASILTIISLPTLKAEDVKLTEHLLQDGFGYAYGLSIGDLNGDGRPEITVGDADKGELSAFIQQDHLKFERFFVRQGEGSWLERHEMGDIDGDGRPDLVIVCNNAKSILWFKNPGSAIATQPWTRNVISTQFPHAYDVTLFDFNGDGLLDVAASSYKGDAFTLFLNPGQSEKWGVQEIDVNMGETRTIRTGDFNADGRVDLLGSALTGNAVVWYENTPLAKGISWTKHVIDSESISPVHGHPVDMNSDGKLDVVMAFGHGASPEFGKVVWYENLGGGANWKTHLVGDFPSGFEAVAGDLNGDKKLDIVATSWAPNGRDGYVVWFENTGDSSKSWKKHLLKDQWGRVNSVLLYDLDNDSRLDIIAATERAINEVRWWHNQGVPVP